MFVFFLSFLELTGPNQGMVVGAINEAEMPDYKDMLVHLDEEVGRASDFYDQQFEKLFNQFYGLVSYTIKLVNKYK